MPISSFLALQFLREYKSQTVLTLTAVAVGVAVMVFLSALITGLQESLIEQTLGTQPHIVVNAPQDPARSQIDGPGILRRAENPAERSRSIRGWQRQLQRMKNAPHVTAVAPLVTGSAFALRGNGSQPIIVIGMDPAPFDQIISVSQNLRSGAFSPSGSEAIVGRQLAQNLGVEVGDRVRLSTPESRTALVTVRGIFDLGNGKVNETWVLLPLRTGQALLGMPGGSNTIYARVDSIFDAEDIAERLGAESELEFESWMTANEQLLVALRAQSSSSYTIQFFVFIAVAMGIASVLVVSVVQRTREIGILRAMGVKRAVIFRVFLLQGAVIGVLGSLLGAGLGAGLSFLFSKVAQGPGGDPIFPMALSPQLFALAVAAATLTGVVAAALPARRAAQLEPVEAIRHA